MSSIKTILCRTWFCQLSNFFKIIFLLDLISEDGHSHLALQSTTTERTRRCRVYADLRKSRKMIKTKRKYVKKEIEIKSYTLRVDQNPNSSWHPWARGSPAIVLHGCRDVSPLNLTLNAPAGGKKWQETITGTKHNDKIAIERDRTAKVQRQKKKDLEWPSWWLSINKYVYKWLNLLPAVPCRGRHLPPSHYIHLYF